MTNAGASITWHANENGNYVVRRGGTNCTDGTIVVSSTAYSTWPNTVTSAITAGNLNEGANTLRVCVTDAATNTGASENVRVTKDTTAPTVTIDLPAGSDTGVSDTDNITKAATLVFDVEFSENVFGLTAGDFINAGTATGCLVSVGVVDGDSYDITLTSCSEGTVELRLATAAGPTRPVMGTPRRRATRSSSTRPRRSSRARRPTPMPRSTSREPGRTSR